MIVATLLVLNVDWIFTEGLRYTDYSTFSPPEWSHLFFFIKCHPVEFCHQNQVITFQHFQRG